MNQARACGGLLMPASGSRGWRGFTLIELLVVIAIIAILVGMLLPSLGRAREEGRAIKCAASIRSVALGVITYTTDSRGYLPVSYVYPDSHEGTHWKIADQMESSPSPENGYLHWSWALFATGNAPEGAFACPTLEHGGAPRANPGPNPDDWEPGQTDTMGSSTPRQRPLDRQVRRIAYAGNGLIFPRNKFTSPATQWWNKMVRDSEISNPSRVILATEYANNPSGGWKSLTVIDDATGSKIVKSHRPITPVVGGSVGASLDIMMEPGSGSGRIARFFYPDPAAVAERFTSQATGGESPESGWIGGGQSLLAVGRHHPGSGGKNSGEAGKGAGGTCNFVYMDGHVARKNVIDTIAGREWGDRAYSLMTTYGANNAINMKQWFSTYQ